MRRSFFLQFFAVAGLLQFLGASPAQAAAAAAPIAPVSDGKPAWLSDASVTLKGAYDDNLYLVSGLGAPERSAWVVTVTPKIGINLLPLLPQPQKAFQTLSFSYAPDIVRFNGTPIENYTAHRFTQALKAKSGAISYSLDHALTFIDGATTPPIYSPTLHDDQRSAYASAAPRERRRQLQDRARVAVQYDTDRWFARAVGNLIFYDLMANLLTTPGCQNYADRFDLNAGVDLAYKLQPKSALTLGYRTGREYQQQFPTAIDKTHTSATSEYQRLLVGFEGKLADWLALVVQFGPDYRRYPATTAVHTTPMSHRHPREYYAEAAATVTPTKADSIELKYKQWIWVSSTGKLPYVESTCDLAYRHKFDAHLSLDLGLRYGQSNYTIATGTSALRNDRYYAASCGMGYAFTPRWNATLAYAMDFGRNGEDGLQALSINPDWREFDHHVVSGSVTYKF